MTTHPPTRRSFLTGLSPLRGMVDKERAAVGVEDSRPAFRQPPAGGSPHELGRSSLLVSVRRQAMACDWEAQLSAARDDDSMEHVFAALDLVESLEDQLTVFRDRSEIMEINRRAAEGPVGVERRLFALLQMAEAVHRETDGALDITSAPLSDVWGFSRRQGRLPSEAEVAAALERVGMNYVTLDEEQRTIAFRRPGVSINVNSIGKGYALDRMAELLAENDVGDYLLHGGKSSVLARGGQPGSGTDKETRRPGDKEKFLLESPCLPVSLSPGLPPYWSIGLRHPLRPQERLGQIHLRDQALSTSGSGTQFFRQGGRRFGHILDPRTGWPAEGMYSATVIAPTAAEAEALSTAFYVMGVDKVAEYCRQRPQLAAVLVLPGEREGEVELATFGLDDSRWESVG